MQKLTIKEQKLATRCETCHQADLFDQLSEICIRCAGNNMGTTEPVGNKPVETKDYPRKEKLFDLLGSSIVTVLSVTALLLSKLYVGLFWQVNGIVGVSIIVFYVVMFLACMCCSFYLTSKNHFYNFRLLEAQYVAFVCLAFVWLAILDFFAG